jgi:hypothetical protein
MLVNVSDLYDALHDIATIVFSRFGLGDGTDPAPDELLDQLELDLFLPACARRASMVLRRELDPEDVSGLIRLRERDGSIRPGAAGRYHSHGFQITDDGDIPNSILAANLMPRARQDVELVIVLD